MERPVAAHTVGVSASAPSFGKARFVGDARPIGGAPLSRLLNAACYLVTGIAMFVLAGSTGSAAVAPILVGILAVGYAAKIAFTRASYWISTWVYIVPFGAVVAAITAMSH